MAPKKIALVAAIVAAIVSAYVAQSMSHDLESQNVLSGGKNPYVTEFQLPEGSAPNGLVVDTNGVAWVATKNPVLYSIDPNSSQVTSHEIHGGNAKYSDSGANATMVWAMAIDDHNTIWFAPYGSSSIWGYDISHDTYHTVSSTMGSPFQMKPGDYNEMWFTTLRTNTLGVIEKMRNDTYKISTFDTGNNTNPAGLFLQNDSVWVAKVTSQRISQYHVDRKDGHVNTVSLVLEIPSGNSTLFSSPTDLLVDKSVVWLTEHDTSFLTSYDLKNGKTVRYPTSQNGFHTTTLPFWIRGTGDPKVLWFNEHQGNKIGRLDLHNNTLTEYFIPSLPNGGYLTYPLNISQDPHDEKIAWFSEWNTDKVGMVNGHVQPPFEIMLDTSHVTLGHEGSAVVGMEIRGNLTQKVHLDASSTIMPTAELGNLTVGFSTMPDLTHGGMVQVSLRDMGVAPGNYTVGISATDGMITTTKFIDLSIMR